LQEFLNSGEQPRHYGSAFTRRRSGVRIPSAPLCLRVTAYNDRPPEIEPTLDADALPSTDAASEVLEEAKKVASVEALEEVNRELLRAYKETVLDEETGEWVPADVDPERELEREAETEYEDRLFVFSDSTVVRRRGIVGWLSPQKER
jgi:hypothetical protein